MRFCILPIASVHIGMIALRRFNRALPREPQTILKTDERSTVLELTHEEKFAAKSSGWLKAGGDKLEVAVKKRPLGDDPSARRPPPEPPPVEHYFPME
jgi:hypothetical protein